VTAVSGSGERHPHLAECCWPDAGEQKPPGPPCAGALVAAGRRHGCKPKRAVVRPDIQRPRQLRHHRRAGDAATLELKPIAGRQLVL
jgi:hypothetical protein